MLQFWNLFNAKSFGSNHSAFHDFKHDNGLLLVLLFILAGQWLIVTFGGKMFHLFGRRQIYFRPMKKRLYGVEDFHARQR